MGENLPADVIHHALADDLHEDILDIAKDEGYGDRAQECKVDGDFEVNLVDVSMCRPSVLASIAREGIDL